MKTEDIRPFAAAEDEHESSRLMPRKNDVELLLEPEQLSRMPSVADSRMRAGNAREDVCIRQVPVRLNRVSDSGNDSDSAPRPVKNLHEGHRDKLRKRFIEEGLSNFQKHQILELLLFYAIPRKDTNELAHRLLNAFGGNLSEVFNADIKTLLKVEGIGEQAAVFITMIPQLFQVYRSEMLERMGVTGRERVEQYIANRFTGERVEKVLVACLDNKWNLLGAEFTDTGSVNISSVNRRKIIEVCLRYGATAAIIAHNHPRGTALPSRDDLTTTMEVREALEVIGVRLIDHMIVAGEDYVSLACSRLYCDMF